MGPMAHNGPGSYLDDATLRYGESNLTRTLRVMVDLIGEILEFHAQAGVPLSKPT
jgi:hypothetical protein